jgi:hypothetical protein
MKIKFKHKKDCILKAMGSDLTTKDVNNAVNKIIEKFMTDDSLRNSSHLAELIHNELPYEAILFVALQGVRDRISPDAMERVKRMSKKKEPKAESILDEIRKRRSDRETEPSFEGFQRFVEGLIAGIEREEAKKNEDTKPETDETDKGTKD